MVYDEGTGYLLLSSSLAGETTQLYAIDPENKLAFPAGDFGDKVYPVVSMYQYERIQELTVKLIPTSVSLNEGDTQELVAHVLPMTYQNQVTWTTSDAAVASVDENGCVTALKEGTATITATTVEADAGGGHATASCTITVKGLASVSVEVGGQIVTDEGDQMGHHRYWRFVYYHFCKCRDDVYWCRLSRWKDLWYQQQFYRSVLYLPG